tara:strand:+ start:743 stop:1000 length:258 start_codon:yes stop_codon:yes gene_type:complete
MEEVWPYIIDIAMTLGSTTILALVGFVWRISHKVSSLEKTIESMHKLHVRDLDEVKRDIEVIYNNVDKNREWTTNRMMSIAKEMN